MIDHACLNARGARSALSTTLKPPNPGEGEQNLRRTCNLLRLCFKLSDITKDKYVLQSATVVVVVYCLLTEQRLEKILAAES